MKRRLVAATLVLALLMGAGISSADPSNWGQLGRILLWLEHINSTLNRVNMLADDIKDRLSQAYPNAVVGQIDIFFEPVDSVLAEVEKLACDWRFTPRVEKLRTALFAGGSFCRKDWNAIFGPPTLTVDWDLEHFYDYSAVRRLNLIKTRNEKGPRRAELASRLAWEATQGRDPADPTKPYSPGYSQRLSALAAAELGNVMVETGDTQAAMLELEQVALNDKRRKRLLAHHTAALIYLDLASRSASQAPPLELPGETP
jgi:hypothetical protein